MISALSAKGREALAPGRPIRLSGGTLSAGDPRSRSGAPSATRAGTAASARVHTLGGAS